MTTVEDNPSDAPEQTDTPPAEDTTDAPEQDEADVDTLKKELAAAEETISKKENEAKRWKGRLEKVQKSLQDEESKEAPSEAKKDDLKSEIESIKFMQKYGNRVENVQEDFEDILKNGYEGETVSSSLLALELAEKRNKVENVASNERQASNGSAPSVTNRDDGEPDLTDYDKKMGVNPEVKAKYRDYVEG